MAELADKEQLIAVAKRELELYRIHQDQIQAATERREMDAALRRRLLAPVLSALRSVFVDICSERHADREGVSPMIIEPNDRYVVAAWFGRLRVVVDLELASSIHMHFQLFMLSPKDNEKYVPVPRAVLEAHKCDQAQGMMSAETTVEVLCRLLLNQPCLRRYNSASDAPVVVHWAPESLDRKLNKKYYDR